MRFYYFFCNCVLNILCVRKYHHSKIASPSPILPSDFVRSLPCGIVLSFPSFLFSVNPIAVLPVSLQKHLSLKHVSASVF